MNAAASLILGGLMLAGVTTQPTMAADPAAGRLVANMCMTCHGTDGYARLPNAPHIGGEPQSYLEAQLMAFKTGSRQHEMMSVVTAGLSAQQIADVSAWYAAHTAVAALPEGSHAAGAPDLCVSCHGADGISTLLDAPHLAGEDRLYIDAQLKAFKRGKRSHDIMTEIAASLSDEDIREFANWYASISLEIRPPGSKED
ncbi:MAG: cytochrome c [Rhodobacteraceae bacterium]|nr:cytochrome c [Paracoccaceae bacterium]